MEQYFNLPLLLGVLAIVLAQFLKIPVHYLKTRQLNFSMFKTTGSMPSSHSAGVMALASAVGFEAGFNSPTFAVAAMIAGVVMYDATGIRYHAGQQAIALNDLFQQLKHSPNSPLKTMLGHKPVEVLVGAIIGALFALIVYALLGKL